MAEKLVDKSRAFFWTTEWQEAEREASEDIREGRAKGFESLDELFEELDRLRRNDRVLASNLPIRLKQVSTTRDLTTLLPSLRGS